MTPFCLKHCFFLLFFFGFLVFLVYCFFCFLVFPLNWDRLGSHKIDQKIAQNLNFGEDFARNHCKTQCFCIIFCMKNISQEHPFCLLFGPDSAFDILDRQLLKAFGPLEVLLLVLWLAVLVDLLFMVAAIYFLLFYPPKCAESSSVWLDALQALTTIWTLFCILSFPFEMLGAHLCSREKYVYQYLLWVVWLHLGASCPNRPYKRRWLSSCGTALKPPGKGWVDLLCFFMKMFRICWTWLGLKMCPVVWFRLSGPVVCFHYSTVLSCGACAEIGHRHRSESTSPRIQAFHVCFLGRLQERAKERVEQLEGYSLEQEAPLAFTKTALSCLTVRISA